MAGLQTDLFAAPHPAGLAQVAELVTPEEEAALIARIGELVLSPFQFQGWVGKRLTASFGWHYDFDAARAVPAAPIPDWLLPLRSRAAAFGGLPADALVQVLLTRYDAGAGIGWHRDRAVFEHVIGISLGAPAVMRFRRRKPGGFERATATLAPRSAYHLHGEVRHSWEHSIAEMAATRWSITFRSLARGAAGKDQALDGPAHPVQDGPATEEHG